jgi:hypothetical protein
LIESAVERSSVQSTEKIDMAILAIQRIARAGLNPALAAAAAGDAFPNTGRALLRVKNAHATVARTETALSQLPAGVIAQAR